jgi:hypothetical protein
VRSREYWPRKCLHGAQQAGVGTRLAARGTSRYRLQQGVAHCALHISQLAAGNCEQRIGVLGCWGAGLLGDARSEIERRESDRGSRQAIRA